MAAVPRVALSLASILVAAPALGEEQAPSPDPAPCSCTSCDEACADACPEACESGFELGDGGDLLLAPSPHDTGGLVGAPSHRPEDRTGAQTRDWLLYGGLSVFAASWIGTIIAAGATADGDTGTAVGQGFIPAVGPLVLLAEGSTTDGIAPALPIFSLIQGVGLIGALIGATTDYEPSSTTALRVGPGGVTGRF